MIELHGFRIISTMDSVDIMMPNPGSVVDETTVKNWIKLLQIVRDFAIKYEFIITEQRCRSFCSELEFELVLSGEYSRNQFPSAEEAIRELSGIKQSLREEISKKQFAYIPADKAAYFERDDLLEKSVLSQFVREMIDVKQELKEAGNCLAAGLNTAAVFHLARIAEVGLRKFAKKVGVLKSKKGHALEYSDWWEILQPIHDKLDQMERGNLRNHCREIYGHFVDMKDNCRNEVMHSRKQYNEHDAKSVFESLKKVMIKLAALRMKRLPNPKGATA